MSNLPFEDEGTVYTDERSDAPSVTEKSREKSEDAAHPPVQQALDARTDLQQKSKPTTRHTTDTKTDERENPGQAVRDSYLDA